MKGLNKANEIEAAREQGRKEAAKFIVDTLIAYDEEGNIREIIDIIAEKFGIAVEANH